MYDPTEHTNPETFRNLIMEVAMAKGKILVVDDEADVRDVIKLQLEQRGLNVLEAVDGQNAIDILRSEDNLVNVGVILCDIRMPKVNGVECIQYLREQAPGIPVVVITGYPDTELATDLMKKGVKDYLVKPVEKEKLLAVVDEQISAGKAINF
jgi:two-component system chemotaxis response regulator CheY